MVDNCTRYNGPDHHITAVAQDLKQVATNAVNSRIDEILTYESLVQEGAN
jgi:hypothetical protein